MKQFSLEEFKKNPNRKVVTRSGMPVKIICTDAVGSHPIVGLVKRSNGLESACRFYEYGNVDKNRECENDLFFAPVKREGYINIYRSKLGIVPNQTSFCVLSKEDAEIEAAKYPDDFIATAKVTWEE